MCGLIYRPNLFLIYIDTDNKVQLMLQSVKVIIFIEFGESQWLFSYIGFIIEQNNESCVFEFKTCRLV